MGHLFDQLAKDAAADLPRREAFRRVGGALLGVVLAAVGLAADNDSCGRLCAICCDQNFTPPRNGGDPGAHGDCIRQCQAGEGICGPIWCPGGKKD